MCWSWRIGRFLKTFIYKEGVTLEYVPVQCLIASAFIQTIFRRWFSSAAKSDPLTVLDKSQTWLCRETGKGSTTYISPLRACMYVANAMNTSSGTPPEISRCLDNMSFFGSHIVQNICFEHSQKLSIHPDCSQSMIVRTHRASLLLQGVMRTFEKFRSECVKMIGESKGRGRWPLSNALSQSEKGIFMRNS